MAKASKLPSGNWRCLARKVIGGKMVSKSFTASSKKEAEFLASEWQISEEENNAHLTLKTACERYIEAKENVLSPSTLRGYRRQTRLYLQSIMDVKIDSLTREQIQVAINIEAAKYSPKTVRNIHGLLSAVLGMYRPGFSFKTQLPQKKKTEMHIPTDAEVNKTLSACRGTSLEVAILLAAFGPMRRSEVCAVTSKDVIGNNIIVNKAYVRDEDNIWVLKTPKNFSSNRVIPFPDFVIERIKGIEGNLVPYTPAYLGKLFRQLLEKNNIPHYRFHDLRHYCVSICKAMNIPDEYIMARGGWSTNYTMNNVYAHTLPDVQDAVTTKILNHFETVNSDETVHETAHKKSQTA
jgi:integrase